MNGDWTVLDTAYEWAGFQASAALHGALSGLMIPFLIALCGVAWKFYRIPEDGEVRPLVVYLLSVVFLGWLVSPTTRTPGAHPHLRAPRFLTYLDSGADRAVGTAIRAVDQNFLTQPYEWERLALLARLARIQDGGLRSRVQTFFRGCTDPAILRKDVPIDPGGMKNPLADDAALPYDEVLHPDGLPCETVRRTLLQEIRSETEAHPTHKESLAAMRSYAASSKDPLDKDLEELYVDKLVRNEWARPELLPSELVLAKKSTGAFQLADLHRQTAQVPVESTSSAVLGLNMAALATDVVTSFLGAVQQWWTDAVESKQRFYTVTRYAPHLYGLFVMLLLALFPIAGLYALLPGKWTALVHFGKAFLAVKLWPFGWMLLTAFTERRPVALALADAAPHLGLEHSQYLRLTGTPNLFVVIALMYMVVPAVTFAVVQTVSHAAAMPFQGLGRPAGTSGAVGMAHAALPR